jgi:hypothetical protein
MGEGNMRIPQVGIVAFIGVVRVSILLVVCLFNWMI